MKISEVFPEYVFQRLGKGYNVVATDFKRGAYVPLLEKTVVYVQKLVDEATKDKTVKFWQLEESE